MSAQAGLFNFDGRPASRELIASIGCGLDEFGPDSRGEYIDSGLAMIHRGLHITPEDQLEQQPLVSPGGFVLTWNGRLDNRSDLLMQLQADVRHHTTDAALAMAAYARWGEDGFSRLVGDWSAVVWDNKRRALVMATDFTGNRALYYASDDHRLVWSSSLRVLLTIVGSRAVSTRFVVGYLTGAIPPGITPYDELFSVPPAHAITWTAERTRRVRRFWDFSVGRLRYRDETQYSDELRWIFRDAVRSRLRSMHPVWAEQSGGFDSTTIVCMAHGLLRASDADAPGLETVSYSSDAAPNERQFIGAVERHCQIPSHHLSIEQCYGAVDAPRAWITPAHPSNMALREYELVRTAGSHVLLSGHVGDLVMGNTTDDSLQVADLVTSQPLKALKAARAWSRSCQRPIWYSAHELLTHSVSPALVRHQISSVLRHQRMFPRTTFAYAFVNRFFLRSAFDDLWRDEITRRVNRARALGPVARFNLLFGLTTLLDCGGAQAPSEYAGVSATFPYLHRDLISYVLSLPGGVLTAPGQPRRLMKLAFENILPERITRRFSKGHTVDPVRLRAVREFARTFRGQAHQLQLVKRQYLDAPTLERAFEQIDAKGVQWPKNLREIVRLEHWLRAHELNALEDARSHEMSSHGVALTVAGA